VPIVGRHFPVVSDCCITQLAVKKSTRSKEEIAIAVIFETSRRGRDTKRIGTLHRPTFTLHVYIYPSPSCGYPWCPRDMSRLLESWESYNVACRAHEINKTSTKFIRCLLKRYTNLGIRTSRLPLLTKGRTRKRNNPDSGILKPLTPATKNSAREGGRPAAALRRGNNDT
jgi:hypothetical protein